MRQRISGKGWSVMSVHLKCGMALRIAVLRSKGRSFDVVSSLQVARVDVAP